MIVHFFFLLAIPTAINSLVSDSNRAGEVCPEKGGWISRGLIGPSDPQDLPKESVADGQEVDTTLRLGVEPSLTLAPGPVQTLDRSIRPQTVEKPLALLSGDFLNQHVHGAQEEDIGRSNKRKYSQLRGKLALTIEDSGDQIAIEPSILHQTSDVDDEMAGSKKMKQPSASVSKGLPEENEKQAPNQNLGRSDEHNLSQSKEIVIVIDRYWSGRKIIAGSCYILNKSLWFKSTSGSENPPIGIKNASIYVAHEVMGVNALQQLWGNREDELYPVKLGCFKTFLNSHTIKSTVTYIELANEIFEPQFYKDENELRDAQREAVSELKRFWNEYEETDGFRKETTPDQTSNLLTREEKQAFREIVQNKIYNCAKSNQISNALFLFWMKKNFLGLYRKLHRPNTEILWSLWFVACIQDKLLSLKWATNYENNWTLRAIAFKRMNIKEFLVHQVVNPLKLRWFPDQEVEIRSSDPIQITD